MNILCIGDVVSKSGCECVRNLLPQLKKEYDIDFVIANGENSAVGDGILPSSANHLFDSGVDVITTGNHAFQRSEIFDYMDENNTVLRPANFPKGVPGNGYIEVDLGHTSVAVINLIGQTYLEPNGCPFEKADEILKLIKSKIIIIDFHAEATGEKGSLAYYLDGRVSAVFGTHTHVQTADEQILPKGTGYITDAGMTGPVQSVLGIKPECTVKRMTTHLPTRFETSQNPCALNAVLFKIDKTTGLCKSISRIKIES